MKVLIILFTISYILTNKAQNQLTKFEKAFKQCQEGVCKERQNDDNCAFICISQPCYEQVYGNYLLEYGEYNPDLKNKFEKCFK
jgi:hypothetical protein